MESSPDLGRDDRKKYNLVLATCERCSHCPQGPLCSRSADGRETGEGGASMLRASPGMSSSGLSYHWSPQALHTVPFTVIFTRWAYTARSFLCIPSEQHAVFQENPEGLEFQITEWKKMLAKKSFYFTMGFVVVVWFWCKLLLIVIFSVSESPKELTERN